MEVESIRKAAAWHAEEEEDARESARMEERLAQAAAATEEAVAARALVRTRAPAAPAAASRPPPKARAVAPGSNAWHATRALHTAGKFWSGYDMAAWPPTGANASMYSWAIMPFLLDAYRVPWPPAWEPIRDSLPTEWAEWTLAYGQHFRQTAGMEHYPLALEDFPFHLPAPVQEQLMATLNVAGGAGAEAASSDAGLGGS